MLKTLEKKKNGKKGFTLVELVIVIAVLAIIAAIAIPTVHNVINNANVTTDNSNAQSIEMAIKTCESENAAYNTHESASIKTIFGDQAGKSTISTTGGIKLSTLLTTYGVNPASVGLDADTNLKQGSNYFYFYEPTSGKITVRTEAVGSEVKLTKDSTITVKNGRIVIA